MPSLHIIYASTSGHAEFVIETLEQCIRSSMPDLTIERTRAEQAKPEDILHGDVVILGSGTWNTGGIEGQLNPHMHEFLIERAKDVTLQGKPMTCISLGDDRYYQRTRCTEHFLRFIRTHNGTLITPPLVIVNEPYDQVEKIETWSEKLLQKIVTLPPHHTPPPNGEGSFQP